LRIDHGELRIDHGELGINHGEHGEHGEKPLEKPLTTEAQRHREKPREKRGFVFDFLCVSVSLWLKVPGSGFASLRALRG
jgi:hypothetical protein